MSEGINVYDEVRSPYGFVSEAKEFEKQAAEGIPCIFLSHRRGDKERVKEFGEYIKKAGINIYLDVEDQELQAAVEEGDDAKITEFIEQGIRYSTDLMIFLSESTRKSWWVPYEIGFGKAAGKVLSCVKLRDVKISDLAYLKIVQCLRTPKEMDAYLEEVLVRKADVGAKSKSLERLAELMIESHVGKISLASLIGHPLDVYMNEE
ncbi:MAG: toll/interleukin-1 receptor domain-containing protein [Verrucomicrobiota bacterium]